MSDIGYVPKGYGVRRDWMRTDLAYFVYQDDECIGGGFATPQAAAAYARDHKAAYTPNAMTAKPNE